MLAMILANANRKPNTPPIPMHEFFYVDTETVRERKDQEMIAFLAALKSKSKS